MPSHPQHRVCTLETEQERASKAGVSCTDDQAVLHRPRQDMRPLARATHITRSMLTTTKAGSRADAAPSTTHYKDTSRLLRCTTPGALKGVMSPRASTQEEACTRSSPAAALAGQTHARWLRKDARSVRVELCGCARIGGKTLQLQGSLWHRSKQDSGAGAGAPGSTLQPAQRHHRTNGCRRGASCTGSRTHTHPLHTHTDQRATAPLVLIVGATAANTRDPL